MMTEIVLVRKAVSKVFGDFVSKVVSDGVDVLKSAIKDADLDRKSYNQNLQTRLYQLIVDALNRFTYNKYEKQDKLYAAAESILKGYISTQDNIDAVKSGLKMLVSDVNSDACQDFLEILCGEICRDDNSDLYKEFDMLWKKQESEYFRGEFVKIDQNDKEILGQLSDLREVLDFIKSNMNSQEGDKLGRNGFPIVNRADEYAKKWDKNVFLNDFNKRDKNAGVNIKLKELYLEKYLPHYKWKSDDESSTDLKELLSEYIVDNDDKKMLLILGQAGIGKSTLLTWIMANLVEKKDEVFVYQFANDLDSIDWQSKNVLNDIFSIIGLEYDELDGKTLILDGFDEVYISGDRERVLNKLNQDLERLNTLKSFSVIITCRENYVYNLQNTDYDYIVLQAWDEVQIENFCRKYWEKCGNDISEDTIQKILENKDIFGIPLILYMILALDITIEKNSSMVDVYDQIFSLEKGAIYDRRYDSEHRLNAPEIKEHIYQVSQKMAFWMFENNADKATISQEKFEEICDVEMSKLEEKGEDIQRDILIGNFFKLKCCEGRETDELQFMHRSIYEYFVAIYFFESIHKLKSKEDIAGKLGELLKDGCLSEQILKFIKYKFDNIKELDLFKSIKDIFNIMLHDGMTYYFIKKQREPLSNILVREINIFYNMLELIHLWHDKLEYVDEKIEVYLQYNYFSSLNLGGVNLSEVNLGGAELREANLIRADLREALLNGVDLFEAYLCGANLGGAYLYEADLNGANLREADLREADLREVDLRRAGLSRANIRGADLRGADLREAYLREVDLREVDLRGADFGGADLIDVNLTGANLVGAELVDIKLENPKLEKTIFDEKQIDKLCEQYDLSKSMVYFSETDETISYVEYSIRKHKDNEMEF